VLRHLALIPDGNRRWARENGLPVHEGHLRGVEVVKMIVRLCRQKEIPFLTLWAFSSDNWSRTSFETDLLMRIFEKGILENTRELVQNGVRIRHIGRRDRLPSRVRKALELLEKESGSNTALTLNVAMDYGGRDEILRACREVLSRGLSPDSLNEDLFSSLLDTTGQPDPDLLIRTSGEKRLSGFLPWQCTYTELLFLEKKFPELTEEDLLAATEQYRSRSRRYGGD
jgi:undecaprenyl diphosphate synthase